jgi:hypothetical protein
MKRVLILAAIASTFALAGCDESSDQIQNKQQELLNKNAVQSVGMPAIHNFAEKRMMKDILEMRDQNTVTYTYLVGMNNQLTKFCDSVGFGLPYATQYTNPQKYNGMSQADPNGLYSPASADGTWVACRVPGQDKVKPVFIEPRIIVSPFPINI